MGRWLTRDPIEEQGGINLFVFVYNNPVNHIDLAGLNAIVLGLAGGAAALDGPLPVGDALAAGLLVGLAINNYFFDSGRQPIPFPLPTPDVTPPGPQQAQDLILTPALSHFPSLLPPGIDNIPDELLRRECQRLRKEKGKKCSNISCSGIRCCSEISKRIDKGKECYRLRKRITERCFGGVDNSGRDHAGQEEDVFKGYREVQKETPKRKMS